MDAYKLRNDITGLQFGKLVVYHIVGGKSGGRKIWLCRCACGNTVETSSADLLRGHTKSCGCFQKSQASSASSGSKNAMYKDGRSSGDRKTFYEYKYGAKYRNIPFELSLDQVNAMCLLPCTYCGDLPDPKNGIDRIDNAIGYLVDNCLPCCAFCNIAKNRHSLDTFKDKIRKINNHFLNKGENLGKS